MRALTSAAVVDPLPSHVITDHRIGAAFLAEGGCPGLRTGVVLLWPIGTIFPLIAPLVSAIVGIVPIGVG